MAKKPEYAELAAEVKAQRERIRELEARNHEHAWAMEKLARSEREKQLILDSISDHVVFHDVEQTVLWANSAATCSLEGGLEQLAGQKCFRLWHGRETPCEGCPVLVSMVDGQPRTAEVVTPDGREWLIKSFPVSNEAGAVVGCVEVTQDVTARKAEIKAYIRAKELAEEASRAKSEFLANMSHELRSPLNGVLGMLDLALESGLTEEQAEYVQTALHAGEGLLDIINDILDFSRLEAEKVQVVYDTFDFRETLATVLKSFAAQAGKKGLLVDIDIHESLPAKMWGDERRIRQILFNLVGNAVKFTPQGRVVIQASLLTANRPDKTPSLCMCVEDTGIGIPDETVQSVFEPFTQANWSKSRKYEGTGLGLAIVKRLVALLGGTLCVDTEVGRGTGIWLVLPVKLD